MKKYLSVSKRKISTIFIMTLLLFLSFTVTSSVQAAKSDFEIEDGVLIKYHGDDEKVTIPKSVKVIGDLAFENCSLKSVIIPNSVKTISYGAFNFCSNLKSVNIPNSVTYIDEGAFANCSALNSITIPNSLKIIYGYAFVDCTSLKSITIPKSVKTIGGYAFAGCTNLKSVTISKSVETIGESAFYGTKWLKNKQKENPLVIVNGILIDGKTYTKEKLTIPKSVKSISNEAFYNCKSLTFVSIPKSVKSIGDEVFYGCSDDLVIECQKNSTAHKYAKKYGYNFSLTDGLESLSFRYPKLYLEIGQKIDNTLLYNPTETTLSKKITWKSSKSSVATVKNGKIVALAKGSATITATVAGTTAKCNVTVKNSKYGTTEKKAYAMLKDVLNDKKKFVALKYDYYYDTVTVTTKEIFLKNAGEYYLDYVDYKVTNSSFHVLDCDSDGINEVSVLSGGDGPGIVLLLHYYKGKVYGYEFSYRTFWTKDAFQYGSGGASSGAYSSYTFNGKNIVEFTNFYHDYDYDTETAIWEMNGHKSTQKSFEDFRNKYPAIESYEFTTANINKYLK